MISDIPALHCPFCGGKPLRQSQLREGYDGYEGDRDARAFTVRCRSCAAEGGWGKSEGTALAYWNMRVAIDRPTADSAPATPTDVANNARPEGDGSAHTSGARRAV